MRDPLERLSVRAKLALTFATVCLLAFGVGGWMVSHSARSYLEDEIQERLDLRARALAVALQSGLQSLRQRTEDFASDGHIRTLTQDLRTCAESVDRPKGTELLRHLVENKLPLVPAFTELCIVEPGGELLVTTADPADDVVIAVARQSACASGLWQSALVVRNRTHPVPEFAISTPIRSLDGKDVLGRFSSWVHPSVWIAAALNESALVEDLRLHKIEITIQDQTGRCLVLPDTLAGLAASAESVDGDWGDSALSLGPSRSSSAAMRRHAIADTGWITGIRNIDQGDFSAVAGLQSKFLAVGGALTLLSCVLLFFPLRFLARPLSRLRLAAARLQAGDHSVRVDVESRDEIGALAMAFNHMAAAIQERTDRLERAAIELRAQKGELYRESTRLNAVISSMHDGLLVIDQTGTPVVRNAAAIPLLSLVDGTRLEARSHHPCREYGASEDCSACLLDPTAPSRSCQIDVGRSVFEIRSTPLAPSRDESFGRVLVARDITDRVGVEERQVHQERLAVLGEVASVMAHELNNPLASISMFAQMMESELPVGSPFHENLVVIRRNIESCKKTIRDLLDYATDTSPESLPVDVHAVIEDVVRFLRPVRERAHVAIEVKQEAEDSIVLGDEVQLRQIFVNLLVNAIQAMTEHPGAVRVVTANRGSPLEIDISDHGRGIESDHRELVFKPFFTTKRRGEGTGLGLPTARRIAELHGGGLDLLESSPKGSTFRVKLRVRAKGQPS